MTQQKPSLTLLTQLFYPELISTGQTLTEIATTLSEKGTKLHLFVGEGFKKKWAQDFQSKHDLPNVSFHGYVDKKNLPDLLTIADLGLVSLLKDQVGLSVPSKTFGLLSAGVPVLGILPKESEMAQVLKEEACGVVCPPGDPIALENTILYLTDPPTTLKTMKENTTKAITQHYSLEKAAEILQSILSETQETQGTPSC